MNKQIKKEYIKYFYNEINDYCLTKVDLDFSLPDLKDDELEKMNTCFEKTIVIFGKVFEIYAKNPELNKIY